MSKHFKVRGAGVVVRKHEIHHHIHRQHAHIRNRNHGGSMMEHRGMSAENHHHKKHHHIRPLRFKL